MSDRYLTSAAALELATAQIDAKLAEKNDRGYPTFQLSLAQRNDEILKIARFLMGPES